eukprot:TRINITY_DN1826_c0_g1_i1.p1 TRINITY_DN1826_c0_g1~~TRINITY_DN1826_c0_g1_i1.p1  ORF type:complete len:161 (-),score=49.68 TRINITY_DN1826_c0_g1_i1:339-821(-)
MASSTTTPTVTSPDYLVTKEVSPGNVALHTMKAFKKGDVISAIPTFPLTEKTKYTVQFSSTDHALVGFLQSANHSCAPNTFFDTTKMEVVALCPIEEGSVITFFYPSSELDMAEKFDCNCGAPECLGKVGGASSLSKEVLAKYQFNSHIVEALGLATASS